MPVLVHFQPRFRNSKISSDAHVQLDVLFVSFEEPFCICRTATARRLRANECPIGHLLIGDRSRSNRTNSTYGDLSVRFCIEAGLVPDQARFERGVSFASRRESNCQVLETQLLPPRPVHVARAIGARSREKEGAKRRWRLRITRRNHSRPACLRPGYVRRRYA